IAELLKSESTGMMRARQNQPQLTFTTESHSTWSRRSTGSVVAEREWIKVIIWKLEGKDATCEIFTARGSKGGKRNPKLCYFLQLIPKGSDQRIQIRISKAEADHCMALRT